MKHALITALILLSVPSHASFKGKLKGGRMDIVPCYVLLTPWRYARYSQSCPRPHR